MVVRRHKEGLVLTLDYACRSSTEKPMICHAGLSFKQHALVATVIMYQMLSIWALLAGSLDWRHHDAAHISLLVIGVTNIALATVGVVYVSDILARVFGQQPPRTPCSIDSQALFGSVKKMML